MHVQNTMLLMKALINHSKVKAPKSIEYSAQVYPDEDHSFSKSRKYLLKTISTYLESCFAKPNKESIFAAVA